MADEDKPPPAKKAAAKPKVEPPPPPPPESTIKVAIKFVLRRTYKLISSTLGMVIMLLVYSLLGAVIFRVFEGTHEHRHKKAVAEVGQSIMDTMWGTTLAVKQHETAYKLLLKAELKKYEEELLTAWNDGVTTATDTNDWDFWGSLMYSATVFTTIGYGHISPVTDGGRIATMLYSVIGIPLCLITMADLGKVLTRAIKWLWAFVRRLWYTGRCLKARMLKAAPVEEEKPAASHRHHAKEPPPEPDVPPDEPYIVDDEFNLPIIVAILVTIAYIFLGAALYCQWEDWTYLEAFYFIFISVSTIGFGDVLPEHPKYFLASSLYVLGGLSLVAMVLTVIQESMDARIEAAKVKMAEVTKTIGIAPDDDETTAAS